MPSDVLLGALIVSILAGMIRNATPVLFAALGELVAERSGVLNLGVDGIMLMGAFVGFLAAQATGSLWIGVGAAGASGIAMGLIMAVLSCTLRVDQIISGIGLNLLGSGLTYYWYRAVFSGYSQTTIPTITAFRAVQIPLLSEIPLLGKAIFSQYALTYVVMLMVPAIWFFIYRTKYGLLLRCLGENPRAIDMRGVNVTRIQYLSVMFGGMMAGFGGGCLTLISTGLFVQDITTGRGWLALVIVIAGNWKPQRMMAAALVFGFLEALQINLQINMQGIVNIPHQFSMMLPYVVAVVLLAGGRMRSEAPLSLGVPYERA